MKKLINKKTIGSLALGAVLTCTQANATIITFFGDDVASGQWATDGSGLTSSFVDQSNLIDSSNGYFIETFDIATAMTDLPGMADEQYNIAGASNGCGVNTLSQNGITVTETGGGLGVASQNLPGQAARPGNTGSANYIDSTCYGFTPENGSSGTVEVDYTSFLNAIPGNAQLDYFGFYWGSVDTYNDFQFFNDTDNTSVSITGSQLLTQLGGQSGNQGAPTSNTYVNIDFESFSWNRFVVTSTGIAGEFDNIVTGLTTRNRDVPEPMSIAVFGLGLFGLGLANRKRKFQK
tara:strand:- start:34116 stop:34988 length:873 start_codon:yes stop_codon:yes gene_type:complete